MLGAIQRGVNVIFCGRDEIALEVYFSLQRLGFSIPQDVSVIGFDNQSIISQRVYPKLTTVELPYRNMVLKGYDLIVSEDSHSICNVAISCDPIIRGSLK
ncbi:substrate-binding domain-containing protein [Klebsiella michiganensis]|uniref:substrate-binding domain-containing protein n=1 Tax=Klebsiella michiganensis TaxID=1134687 RepID=UPI003CEEEC11